MNKIATKFLYVQNGLTVPPYSLYSAANKSVTAESIAAKHGFPCFIKCPQSGSSRLMGRADSLESLKQHLTELSPHASELLIETSIAGIEFSCGVLEDNTGALTPLPPIEIKPVQASFFDYEAKYKDGGSLEIVPAPYPEPLLKQVQDVAIAAHRILGCAGVSRTDMIYSNEKLYVLETNTLPGMTSASLLPKAFKAAGGTYPGLLEVLINSALTRRPNF